MPQLSACKEDSFLGQQECNLNDIKEEQCDPWFNQKEQHHWLRVGTITTSPMKTEKDDEKPQLLHVYHSQMDESSKAKRQETSSTDHRILAAQVDEADYGGQPPSASGLQPDAEHTPQLSVCKEENFLGQLECNLSDVKEEKWDPWFNQEEQQHHWLREGTITKIPMKTENDDDDDEKPLLLHVYHSQMDTSPKAKLPGTSSADHRGLSARADGDYYGEQAPSNSGLQADAEDKSSETESDDSFEWYPTQNLRPRSCRLRDSDASFSDSRCNVAEASKPFRCSKCTKSFEQMSDLNIHVKIHTGEKPLVCSLCGQRFGSCECGKSFLEKSNLNKDVAIHAGEKPFTCSECGKRFEFKSYLSQHMRIHTGEKPFVCSVCGKWFRQKGSLTVHERTHSGEKPFGCSECGKRFGRKITLNIHSQMHSGVKPFACSDCGRRFGTSGALSMHMRIHKGERPFSCHVCGKGFRQKNHLNMHLGIHSRRNNLEVPSVAKDFG